MSSPELLAEPTRVTNWRYEQLTQAGYRKRNAQMIADDTTMDLRYACNLRLKCRDETLCMRILYGSKDG